MLGIAGAVAGIAGQTDLGVATIGLLLAGLLILVVDVRRRQGDLARRLRQVALRQVHAARNDRLGELKRDLEKATRRSLIPLTDELRLAVTRMETAGDQTLTGIAQERLAAAERQLELLDLFERVTAELGVATSGIAGLDAAVAESASEVGRARQDVLASLDEAAQANKRRNLVLREHVDRLGYEPVRQVQALLQLTKRVEARAPLPATGGWAMEPTTLVRLLQIVDETRPDLVVECGSGASTVWLAYALEALGAGRVVALEHDEKYAEQTRRMLAEHGLSAVAEVRTAPLSAVEVNDQTYTWYDRDAIQDLKEIELLVVDGPPRASGPRARYPAVPLLGTRLAPGARVVLDDIDRPEEQEAAEAWLAEIPGLVREGGGTDRSALMIYRPE